MTITMQLKQFKKGLKQGDSGQKTSVKLLISSKTFYCQ